MSIQDRPYVFERVASNGGYFGLGASGNRQSGNGGSAKVVKSQAGDTGFLASLPPRGPETVLRPWLIVGA